mgnify:CR=1 FL=1
MSAKHNQITPDYQANHDAEGFCRVNANEINIACKRFFRSRNMPESIGVAADIDRRRQRNKKAAASK